MAKGIEIIRPFSRNMAQGLDATEVWYSYEDALEYAHTSPVAYLGQPIVIINQALKKVYLYQVCYDREGKYNYSIENKQSGGGGAETAFNLLGSVDSYSDLPKTGSYGDMYYSKRDARFYIAVNRETTGELTWIYLKLNIDYVSAVVDGILSYKTYRTFINNTGKPAIYYNNGTNDPNTNGWMTIDNEGTTNKTALVTTNAVKNIVSDLLSNFKPSAEFYDINETYDVNAFVQYLPAFMLKYKCNSGGDIKTASIYKSTDDQEYTFTGIRYVSNRTSGISSNTGLIQWDDLTKERTIKFIDMIGFTPDVNTNTYYKIVIETFASDDNVVKAMTLEYKVVYKSHFPIYIGNNNKNSEVLYPSLDGEFDIKLTYDGNVQDIYQLYIDIPSDRQLTKVTYLNMSDEDCLSLFINDSDEENVKSPIEDIVKEYSSQTYTRYRYTLSSLNINELTAQLRLAGYNTDSTAIQKIIREQFPRFDGIGTFIFHIV